MLIDSLLVFDCTLGLALIAVATGMLLGRDLFRAIVLFILFGLLLTFAWCRLDAVDIALAEAGIGAGLTGALLLNTWAATVKASRSQSLQATGHEHLIGRTLTRGHPFVPATSRVMRFSGNVFSALLLVAWMLAAGAMAALIVPLAVAMETPAIAIDEALPDSGVSHPVTAVLLNFRAYDTLLEVAVLLAAALAVLPLTMSAKGFAILKRDQKTKEIDLSSHGQISFRIGSKHNKSQALPIGAVLEVFIKLMVPVAALVAAYILWAGTKAPGGAFQSAALFCAMGVLLLVSGWRSPHWTQFRWRFLMVVGLGVFLLVGLAGTFETKGFLAYRLVWASTLILIIEICLTVSLTVILISLFSSTSPSGDGSDLLSNQVSTAVNSTKEEHS